MQVSRTTGALLTLPKELVTSQNFHLCFKEMGIFPESSGRERDYVYLINQVTFTLKILRAMNPGNHHNLEENFLVFGNPVTSKFTAVFKTKVLSC